MKNPWQQLSVTEVYDNPWIKVEHHEVINPKGGSGIYGKVHFKNLAIGIIPLDDELNTWLVGQYRYTLDAFSWEIPMGGGPLGIDELASAKRELREETGLTAKDWSHLLDIHTSNSVTDEKGTVFLARELEQGETEFDATEDLVIKKISFDDALRMVLDGEITDSLSVAGILTLARRLKL